MGRLYLQPRARFGHGNGGYEKVGWPREETGERRICGRDLVLASVYQIGPDSLCLQYI